MCLISGFTFEILQKAYACSIPINKNNECILFNISCGGNRIRLRRALHGFHVTQPVNCSHENKQCRVENRGCCTKADGDVMRTFAEGHYYDLNKECSWQRRCVKQTHNGNDEKQQLSKYSVVYYECQAGSFKILLFPSFQSFFYNFRVAINFNLIFTRPFCPIHMIVIHIKDILKKIRNVF